MSRSETLVKFFSPEFKKHPVKRRRTHPLKYLSKCQRRPVIAQHQSVCVCVCVCVCDDDVGVCVCVSVLSTRCQTLHPSRLNSSKSTITYCRLTDQTTHTHSHTHTHTHTHTHSHTHTHTHRGHSVPLMLFLTGTSVVVVSDAVDVFFCFFFLSHPDNTDQLVQQQPQGFKNTGV